MISCAGGNELYERAKRLATILEAKAKSADPRLAVVIVPGTNTLEFGMLMFEILFERQKRDESKHEELTARRTLDPTLVDIFIQK